MGAILKLNEKSADKSGEKSKSAWNKYRLSVEQSLFDELINNSSVTRAIGRIRSHFSGYGFGRKRDLLAHSVRLTPRIHPELFRIREECVEKLNFREPFELYISSWSSHNAYCYKPPVGNTIIVLSSQIIKDFTPGEIKFVLGHELGHAIFEHAAIPMPLTSFVTDAAGRIVPLDTTLKLFKWSRSAEFSADRLGLVCAGSLDNVISAFFKMASGLNIPITLDHTKSFLAQINSLVFSPIARPELNPGDSQTDCFSTHPFSPLRVRSIMRFGTSEGFRHDYGGGPFEISNTDLERLVTEDLSLMDPDYLQDKTPKSQILRELLLYAGVLVANADGEVHTSEMEALATLLGKDKVDTLPSVELAQSKSETLFQAAKAQTSLLERTRVIQHLTIIALADQVSDEREIALIEKFAGSLEVDPAIVSQTILAATNSMD